MSHTFCITCLIPELYQVGPSVISFWNQIFLFSSAIWLLLFEATCYQCMFVDMEV